jgi:integrase
LFAHATGRWAKKIRGKLHYFGPWDDPDAALAKYLEQKDYLHAGKTPPVTGDGLTMADLCNRYLTSKKYKMEAGEITARYFRDLFATCERVVNTFGRTRLVSDLAADDFERLKNVMAETLGALARKTEIQKTRSIFKYAYDNDLIDRPVKFGSEFKAPSKRVLKREKRKGGKRMFEANELRKMIDAATPHFRAMLLLGVNCGFGNNDIATLHKSDLDLDDGWVDHDRPKTGAERRCPLWPETVDALKVAIVERPEPKNPDDDDLVFITQAGNPWVRLQGNGWNDAVTIVCRELLKNLGLKRPGRNFYALRHTFETIAGESLDQVAVDHIMGHSRDDMASIYRERISDQRLRAVTDHVRAWLFGESAPEQ